MDKVARHALFPAYVILCLVLGGASAAGHFGNLLLQLLAIPLIVWALISSRALPLSGSARQLLLLVAAAIILIGAQLIPLPPSIWTSMPGREAISRGFHLLDQPLPWLPISLAPYNTIASALWLLPALAVLLGILRLGTDPRWIAWSVISVLLISVIVGALQITGGDDSLWYFYDITNLGSAVGFFANANHMANLLVISIPFLAALYGRSKEKKQSEQASMAMFVLFGASLAVIFVGIGINKSLAALGLSVPVITASLLLIGNGRSGVSARWVLGLLVLTTASVLVIFSEPFGNNLTSSGTSIDPLSRQTSFLKSLKAAGDFMPFGSGIGTFQDIYTTYENHEFVTATYMNHVHNDYIELALEAGIAGVLLIGLFLAWWGLRVISIWTVPASDAFAKAASIASAAILAHSFVDYPLRTAALSVVFAFCCAVMAEPRLRRTGNDKEIAPFRPPRHLTAH